jgi:cyclase
MQRERLTEDVYVFTSELYAQTTASVVLTPLGAVLIDTLVYPEEARAIRRFVETRLNARVRYVINTHYHADHTFGTCFFPEAQVIAHGLCRHLLDTRGRASAQQMASSGVQLVLPQITFDQGELVLNLGRKTLHLWHTPGHSPDSIVVWCREDNVLFGADTLMPLPFFVDGNYDQFVATLSKMRHNSYEHIVQGHGDVLLRGEVDEKIVGDLHYLQTLREQVDRALLQGQLILNNAARAASCSTVWCNNCIGKMSPHWRLSAARRFSCSFNRRRSVCKRVGNQQWLNQPI